MPMVAGDFVWWRLEIAAMLNSERFSGGGAERWRALFAQWMDSLPWASLARSEARFGGDIRVRDFSCAK